MGCDMSRRCPIVLAALLFGFSAATRGDDLLYRYEGDVLPYDPSAGWLDGLCEDTCHESLENGYFVLRWPEVGDSAAYTYVIAQPPVAPPTSLWIEWRIRSNHPIPLHSYSCDAALSVKYQDVSDLIFIYGDAVVSFSGSDFVWHLLNNEFRTYRFESSDGVNYWFSVDGLVFRTSKGSSNNGYNYLQFRGRGGCLDDWIPNMENAWDFVRFGTISYGEKIVAADPPAGFLDARRHAGLDRFTITFDSPNYVYLDEITVETIDGDAPIPLQTRRLDNGPPDVVEIVLDRPIPYHASTRFTFDDGTVENVVEYTFAPGDANGDGSADLSDFATFQNCFGLSDASPDLGLCAVFDFDAGGDTDLLDFAEFQNLFNGSHP